jgi:CRP-like cAMP-binding protein
VIALEAVDLLNNLSPEQLSRVALIAHEESHPTGKVILEPRTEPDALYVVLDGTVEIARHGEVLHTACQNEVLGAWALFDSDPLPMTARTAEPCRLLRISREDFFDLLSDNVEITAAIFSTLVRRFRKLVEE